MSVELNITDLKQNHYPGLSIPSPEIRHTTEVRVEPDRVVFLLGSQERWVIDSKLFDGNPKLMVYNRPHNIINIELTGAFFPGTTLPADLICKIYDHDVMELRFDFGLHKKNISLDEWLAGEQPVSGTFDFGNTSVCRFGIQGGMSFKNWVSVDFFPGWTFHIKGNKFASLYNLGLPIYSDDIIFGIPSTNHPSLFSSLPERRTIFSLQSIEFRKEPLVHAINLPDGWTILSPHQPYDELHIETAIVQNGGKEQAFVSQVRQGNIKNWRLKFQGKSNSFLLHNVIYAMGFDDKTIQAVQFGKFSTEPIWYHLNGCSLLLGDGPESKFELIARDKRIEYAIVAPALLSFVASLPEMIVEAVPTTPFKVLGIYPTGTSRHSGFEETEKLGLPALQVDPDLPAPVLVMSDLSFSLLRTKDFLLLRFSFMNLEFRTGGGKYARLERKSTNTPTYMLVHFAPQHIAEQVFEEQKIQEPPVSVRMSGPSRLVFRIPKTVRELPYTLESLLNWSNYEQSVVPAAIPSPVSPNLLFTHLSGYNVEETSPLYLPELPPQESEPPKMEHTWIEVPYRLILSPNWFAGWAHTNCPVTFRELTELWHTRLGVRIKGGVDEQEPSLRTVRAIWHKDNTITEPPFDMSLSADSRTEIVNNSSNYPDAIQVNRMMLSSLGAWLDLKANWPNSSELSYWIQQTAMGRDNYVKRVEEGYIFPFGHRAAKIIITERRFKPNPNPKIQEMVAYLVRWEKVIIREIERSFPIPGMCNEGRQFPYQCIKFKNKETPELDLKSKHWLMVNGKDFLFNVEGIDLNNETIALTPPLAFVSDLNDVSTLINEFNISDRRIWELKGQKLSFAHSSQPGDTSFPVNTMTIEAVCGGKELPGYYPIMANAKINLPAVQQFADSNHNPFGNNDSSIIFSYHNTYLQYSFDPTNNPAEELFIIPDDITIPKPNPSFPVDKIGGIVNPDLTINGLSRKYGPVAARSISESLDDAKIAEILGNAKLLGGIMLKKIVKQVKNIFESPGSIPQMTSRVIYPKINGIEDTNKIPEAIETRYLFEPELESDDDKLFEVTADSSMKISALIYTTPSKSTYDVTGELRNFKVNLIGADKTTQFLKLHFSQLTFNARSGQKPVVTPVIKNVEFCGALQFVKNLQEFLKSVSDESGIDVTFNGVTVSSSSAIPNVTLGILDLQNLTYVSRFILPFDGSPSTFYFAFASRENPFLITVGTFGGGGFFGIMLSLDPKKPVKLLEASLEFGGNEALDLGVASGGVYLMAGIYYQMEIDVKNNRICQLTGYVRCGGALQVLGLITVSAEFYLSLNYRDPGTAWGQATLTVKIKTFFYSKKVKLIMEKQFAGSSGDSFIEEIITEKDWREYCNAFD